MASSGTNGLLESYNKMCLTTEREAIHLLPMFPPSLCTVVQGDFMDAMALTTIAVLGHLYIQV